MLPDTDGALEIIHSLSSRPQLQKGRQQVDCVAVCLWSYDHTLGWGGKAAEAAETQQRMLSSEQKGLPSFSMRRSAPGQPENGSARWSSTDTEHSLNALPVCWNAAAAAKHTLSHLIAQAWPRSGAGAGKGSRAIPQTLMLLMHSEGKRSERTAVLPDLILEFRINISKIMILKDSLSLWYPLVPNFWNSPGWIQQRCSVTWPLNSLPSRVSQRSYFFEGNIPFLHLRVQQK